MGEIGSAKEIAEKVRAGHVRTVARLITLAENHDPIAVKAIKQIYPDCGKAHLIGITGPPGVGKSSLIAALVREFRRREKSVGVVAVDPSSPFSGGAFLGDRARMVELSGDKDVFIRSLASRGKMGGLSSAVNDTADILDVFGKEIILIETVGAGQSEVDVAGIAHTVLVVLMPGYGDQIQAMKAGIMEIADLLVVNKADKSGADATVADLSVVQSLACTSGKGEAWPVPVLKTSTVTGEGIEELVDAIAAHYEFIREHRLLAQKSRDRRTKEFLDILTQRIRDEFMEVMEKDQTLQHWVQKIGNLELDPYSASEQVITMIKEVRKLKFERRMNAKLNKMKRVVNGN
jgi:LAO/AO transport system kinase